MLIDGHPGDSIDACDRGLHYGDGLFETVAVRQGEPLLWREHLDRLRDGCARLGIPKPDDSLLRREARQAIPGEDTGVLKILLTRGCGGRGYRAPGDPVGRRIMAFHARPDYPFENWTRGITVRICGTRLGKNPAIAGLKHLNRLEQVVARSEWDDRGIAEGLMQDSDGHLIEGTMSNLFLLKGGHLFTPSLDHCGVVGVMRRKVLECAAELGISCTVGDISMTALEQAEALFLTNALIGIWPVRQVGDKAYSVHAIPSTLRDKIAPHALVPDPVKA